MSTLPTSPCASTHQKTGGELSLRGGQLWCGEREVRIWPGGLRYLFGWMTAAAKTYPCIREQLLSCAAAMLEDPNYATLLPAPQSPIFHPTEDQAPGPACAEAGKNVCRFCAKPFTPPAGWTNAYCPECANQNGPE